MYRRIILAFLILLSTTAFPHEPLIRLPDSESPPVFSPTILFPGRMIVDQQGTILSVIIPLKQAGRLLLLEAIIDGRIGIFILDTGSTGLVLNQTYFRDYMPMDEVDAGGITGSAAPTHRVRVKRLQLAGIEYSNLYADVTSLAHIENRRGIQVYGLFGLNLIKDMEMVIDVRHHELQLHRLDKAGNRLTVPAEKIIFDITGKVDEHQNMAYVEVEIGEKKLEFCLDTGAESNVLDMGLPKNVLSTVAILRRSTLQGAGSGSKDVLYGNMNDFNIGGKKIGNMQVLITNLSGLSQRYGYTINGMLGYDFFEKGKIYINLVKHELGIVLNKEGNL
ncbi:MAG: hypothetical protein D4R67_05535 [Bacteroidetes bacterium]|nr:MAG: hypothetical protein D4R67_05535 [Bacteroidota bacterium]